MPIGKPQSGAKKTFAHRPAQSVPKWEWLAYLVEEYLRSSWTKTCSFIKYVVNCHALILAANCPQAGGI
jgi:hypothetical protein